MAEDREEDSEEYSEGEESYDEEQEYDNEVLRHLIKLLSEPDYQIPYEDYGLLLQKYDVVRRVLADLNNIRTRLREAPPAEHTDVLLEFAQEYDPLILDEDYAGEGFNGELIEPAIAKVQKMLIPADIIIGLFNTGYEIPRVESKILRKVHKFIHSIIVDEIGPVEKQTPERVEHIRGVIRKYLPVIPNFSHRELTNILDRLDRMTRPSPYSQDKNGGKSKKLRKNKSKKHKKRYTRR